MQRPSAVRRGRWAEPALAALCLLLAGRSAAATVAAPADADAERAATIARLDGEIEAMRRAWEVPGLAVAIVQHGEVLLAKGYGVRRLGGAEPVDADTLFAIGSTTKAMTASLIGQLVSGGKLQSDDPVIRH